MWDFWWVHEFSIQDYWILGHFFNIFGRVVEYIIQNLYFKGQCFMLLSFWNIGKKQHEKCPKFVNLYQICKISCTTCTLYLDRISFYDFKSKYLNIHVLKLFYTRMYYSRMRTVRCSGLLGVCLSRGRRGVCLGRGCLPRGVSAQGAVCLGWCAPRGGPARHPPLWTAWQTGVKTLLSAT